MDDNEFLKELIKRGAKADEAYFEYAHIVACLLDKRLHEQLQQILNGPVWDGNVICSELFDLGLAIRVCCKGEQGYIGATYYAYSVMKKVKEINGGRVGA